ncbi:CynX/NimT family MFS transporter [Limosilactobacillus caecicola]|uniref:CynX/NimT family MFS transporter n=1 Tax=Limosilactobacillus caecicola TaxID=2941332 RepID=UPI0020402051|nr:MFS transporter [Limosilactobacillus caecicola]
MNKIKQHSPFLIVGLILLGACMRMPITSIPSVINEIAATFHVAPTSLGILTTIPLICFGLLSSVVSNTAQRIGNEITITIALVIMVVGSYLRIIDFSMLMVGTVLVGVAITCINVLLPAIISDKYPDKVGSMTGVYNTSMAAFSAIGAYAITPISHLSSWQTAVIIISLVALVTIVCWLPNLKYNQRDQGQGTPEASNDNVNMWTNKNAWLLLLFFAFQCFVFYSVVAWLPTIAMDAGLSGDQASLVAGLFQLFAIPFAFLVPVLATKLTNRQPLVLGTGIASLIGAIMMLFPVKSFGYFTIIAFLSGAGSTGAFVLVMTLFSLKTTTPTATRKLSGMVQSVGYLIAATGPIITGNLNTQTHQWTASIVVLIVVAILFTIFGVLSERHQYV